jgi:hypothetical protein
MYYYIAVSTLSSILFTFLITRQWFEPEYNSFKYIIGWYGLKTYTKMNKYVKKIYKIKNYFYPMNDDIFDIHFISNGHEVVKISNKDIDLCKIKTYDFIFYEFYKEDEPKYMVIRDKASNEFSISVEDIEKSNVRFLAPQIIIDKVQTLIDFNQNIYLVNNKLFSRPFITWYMKSYHDILLENTQEYSIRFFDNNMDFIQINSEQCVILGKDTYEIVNYKKEETDAETDASETETDASETETDASETETDASETETDASETDAEDEELEEDASETDAEDEELEEETEAEDETEAKLIEPVLHITQERGC